MAEGTEAPRAAAPGEQVRRNVARLLPVASSSTPLPSRRSGAPTTAAAVVLLASLGLIALPLAGVAHALLTHAPHAAEGDPQTPTAWSLLLETLAWAAGIGIGAAVLAIPAACLLRARGWSLAPILLVPLTLPTYFVYSAYGLARAPGTRIGDWIELAAQHGSKQIPLIVGKVLALGGLSLWAWPLAAVVMASHWRHIDQTVLDSLRLERASPVRRGWELVKLGRAGLLTAAAAVSLVMLGSAVPLHLAQVRTFALEVWTRLALKPGDVEVWVTAWPLVAVAIAAGFVLSRRAAAPQEIAPSAPAPRRRLQIIGTGIVWSLSTVVPLVLFALSVRSRASYGVFWRVGSEAILGSISVAAGVGVLAAAITCLTWLALADGPGIVTRAVVRSSLFLWLIGGLLPGVLVGSAVLQALNAIPGLREVPDSPWVLVIGHMARYGCVPALLGAWLAASEPSEHRLMRRLDGAVGLWGWTRACLPDQAGVVVAAGIGAACLSLHEIEASVILQPPGTPSLAQMLLGYLHFAKTEEMSVAAVLLVGTGLMLAVAAALAASRAMREPRAARFAEQ